MFYKVASVWADSFDVLLDAYQQIAESIPLLLQFRSLFEKSPEMGKVLEVIYEDILEFHQSALRMFGKSSKPTSTSKMSSLFNNT